VKFSGNETINTNIEKIWEFITDPRNLSICLPNVKDLKQVSDNKFEAKAQVGIGFIKLNLNLALEYVEKIAPNKLKLKAYASGQGNYVDLDISINLNKLESLSTELNWDANVNVRGTLASIGYRYLEDVANKVVEDMFNCLKTNIQK